MWCSGFKHDIFYLCFEFHEVFITPSMIQKEKRNSPKKKNYCWNFVQSYYIHCVPCFYITQSTSIHSKVCIKLFYTIKTYYVTIQVHKQH